MPRPKVGDKRADILRAATERIAEEGVEATTSAIAKAAGIAEGSLFRYFADKDTLLNAVYCEIKSEIKDPLSAGFPDGAPLRQRAAYLWDAYVSWGAANPAKRKAMDQLSVSDRITGESRRLGQEGLEGISETMREVAEHGRFRELPAAFTRSLFVALADATMTLMIEDLKRKNAYQAAGFQAFWSAAVKEKQAAQNK